MRILSYLFFTLILGLGMAWADGPAFPCNDSSLEYTCACEGESCVLGEVSDTRVQWICDCPKKPKVKDPVTKPHLWTLLYSAGPRMDGEGYQLGFGVLKERRSGWKLGGQLTLANSNEPNVSGWMMDPWWKVQDGCAKGTIRHCNPDDSRIHVMFTAAQPIKGK